MTSNDTLAEAERRMIEDLRSRGFAVVVFTPLELQAVSATTVEELLCERGHIAIDALS